jgi:hypothetical protein
MTFGFHSFFSPGEERLTFVWITMQLDDTPLWVLQSSLLAVVVFMTLVISSIRAGFLKRSKLSRAAYVVSLKAIKSCRKNVSKHQTLGDS